MRMRGFVPLSSIRLGYFGSRNMFGRVHGGCRVWDYQTHVLG